MHAPTAEGPNGDIVEQVVLGFDGLCLSDVVDLSPRGPGRRENQTALQTERGVIYVGAPASVGASTSASEYRFVVMLCFHAFTANDEVVEKPGVDTNTTLVKLKRTYRLQDGRSAEITFNYYEAENFRVSTTLHKVRERG